MRVALSLKLLGTILIFSACSNDFDMNLPGSSMPVVHFILDPFENEYYATITKTAIDSQDIFNVLNQPELFFPSQLKIDLELWNDSVRLWYSDFSLVDKNKDPGLFPSSPGYLYKSNRIVPRNITINGQPQDYPTFRYFRLMVNGDDFAETAYSRVEFGVYPEITKPRFVDQKVRLYGPEPLVYGWESSGIINYFDFYFQINYSEKLIDGQVRKQSKKFLYTTDVQSASNSFQVVVNPDFFYQRLAAEFPNIPDSAEYRQFKSFDVVLVGGDSNFEYYKTFNESSFDSSIRPWTNITNGLGVFALKYLTRKDGFGFHQLSIDSLADGQYTRSLKFKRY